MKITLDIPKGLLEEARQVSKARSDREAVIAGLHEIIRKSHSEELRRLAGRLDISLDLRRSRGKKRA